MQQPGNDVTIIDLAIAELEQGMTEHPDPIMALADCVGVVLLHWDELDVLERRQLLARVDTTIRTLEERLVLH